MADSASQPARELDSDGAERRRHRRVEMPLRARFLTADGGEHNCIVSNISAGGALLKTKAPPPIGAFVVLYVESVGRFEGQVIRSARHKFAIDYRSRRSRTIRNADVLTESLNLGAERVEQRLAPRFRHESHATVILESGEAAACSISDISLTGASIEIDPRPALGTEIRLGRMRAKVVRRHEKGVGVVFIGQNNQLADIIEASTGPGQAGADIASRFGRKGNPS